MLPYQSPDKQLKLHHTSGRAPAIWLALESLWTRHERSTGVYISPGQSRCLYLSTIGHSYGPLATTRGLSSMEGNEVIDGRGHSNSWDNSPVGRQGTGISYPSNGSSFIPRLIYLGGAARSKHLLSGVVRGGRCNRGLSSSWGEGETLRWGYRLECTRNLHLLSGLSLFWPIWLQMAVCTCVHRASQPAILLSVPV